MERILLVALAAVVFSAAAAQENLIKLETDRDIYSAGDFMVIHGSVSTVLPGESVRMQIVLNGTVVEIGQFDVAADGTYAYIVKTDGANWKQDGLYTLRVWYGTQNTGKNFDFRTVYLETPDIMLEVEDGRGGTFDVYYAMQGGVVDNVRVDYESRALVLDMVSEKGGVLLIDLPRVYINATAADGTDERYIVLADGVPIEHQDDYGSDIRRIKADIPGGTEEVSIIGTSVVPEFGLAVAAMATGAAAIMFTRLKSRIWL